MEKVKKDKNDVVADAIKDINKKFGDSTIMKLDQRPLVGLECIPSGSFGLDIALGIGGYPRGRMIEISGPESSGKTTLALHAVAEAQKKGDICAFIDAEHAMDPEYAKRLGVDTSELFISQPESGEQALEILETLVRTAKFGVLVVDSVATLTPKAELEGDMGQQHVGRQARLMGQALRKLVGVVAKSNTLVIFINQIRTNINTIPGMPTEFTPGGKALKFYASVRIDIRRIAQIKKGEEVMGGRTRIKVVKNKVAPPFKQTEFDLMYNEGISKEGELLVLGEKHGVLIKSGNSYYFGDVLLGRGYDASRIYLREHGDESSTIKKAIEEKLTCEQ